MNAVAIPSHELKRETWYYGVRCSCDRVLALVAQVRQGNSEDELDEMQREVDEILRETLNSYDDGAIDENDLSAFSLALEQFHHAVTDRKAGMNSMASDLARFRSRQ